MRDYDQSGTDRHDQQQPKEHQSINESRRKQLRTEHHSRRQGAAAALPTTFGLASERNTRSAARHPPHERVTSIPDGKDAQHVLSSTGSDDICDTGDAVPPAVQKGRKRSVAAAKAGTPTLTTPAKKPNARSTGGGQTGKTRRAALAKGRAPLVLYQPALREPAAAAATAAADETAAHAMDAASAAPAAGDIAQAPASQSQARVRSLPAAAAPPLGGPADGEGPGRPRWQEAAEAAEAGVPDHAPVTGPAGWQQNVYQRQQQQFQDQQQRYQHGESWPQQGRQYGDTGQQQEWSEWYHSMSRSQHAVPAGEQGHWRQAGAQAGSQGPAAGAAQPWQSARPGAPVCSHVMRQCATAAVVTIMVTYLYSHLEASLRVAVVARRVVHPACLTRLPHTHLFLHKGLTPRLAAAAVTV